MQNEIVTPTYQTWEEVPRTASLNAGDILPDCSTVLWKSRTVTATGNITASWGGYDISTDDPSFPSTAKDMSNMHKWEEGETLYGSQAQKNQWYRKYKSDMEGADDSNYENQKEYRDTFKSGSGL
jgi:hypothetical protein